MTRAPLRVTIGKSLLERRNVMASQGSSSSWLHARALWAGLSIIMMWLAVLFVGVFGGNIVTHSADGGGSSWPVVVALLPFVLPATIVVARRGFTSDREERQSVADEEKQAREKPGTQPTTLGPKPA